MPLDYPDDPRIITLDTLAKQEGALLIGFNAAKTPAIVYIEDLPGGGAFERTISELLDIEEIIMAVQNTFDGYNRFLFEWKDTATVTIKEGSKGIGVGGVYYEVEDDIDIDTTSDLDTGTIETNKAYNLYVGLNSSEEVTYYFSLLNDPPATLFNALCFGCVCTDGDAYLTKFLQKKGRLYFGNVGKSLGTLPGSGSLACDLSEYYTSNFLAHLTLNGTTSIILNFSIVETPESSAGHDLYGDGHSNQVYPNAFTLYNQSGSGFALNAKLVSVLIW